jgi:hypothetical protein
MAQNEYAAYYLPARYLAEVNPQYVEVLMWLASHVPPPSISPSSTRLT